MRRLIARLALTVALAAIAAGRIAAAAEDVEIRDGQTTLRAVMFKPEGSGPFPAVVCTLAAG